MSSCGGAADKIDDLQPPLDVAAGIGEYLAVLARQQFRERSQVLFDQRLEANSTCERRWALVAAHRGCAPSAAAHRRIQFAGRAERHARLNQPRRRVEHLAETGGLPRRRVALDVMNICLIGLHIYTIKRRTTMSRKPVTAALGLMLLCSVATDLTVAQAPAAAPGNPFAGLVRFAAQ